MKSVNSVQQQLIPQLTGFFLEPLRQISRTSLWSAYDFEPARSLVISASVLSGGSKSVGTTRSLKLTPLWKRVNYSRKRLSSMRALEFIECMVSNSLLYSASVRPGLLMRPWLLNVPSLLRTFMYTSVSKPPKFARLSIETTFDKEVGRPLKNALETVRSSPSMMMYVPLVSASQRSTSSTVTTARKIMGLIEKPSISENAAMRKRRIANI